ncbi:VOC family protein [Halobacterium sp. R2-5]|uniref:VOC family protein n=1 Tax=Halobacterium sp. R2-5 TaxID=2715751 RepID=UPI00141E3F49|nr:VOC family protein [Halobacterium sp. R2-5]NIB99856.1 VOC family protein [Halobacterium sp. R2-5]
MTTHPDSDALPQETRIGRTALRVDDLEAMTEFYRDVVGLDALRRSDTVAVLGAGDAPLLVLEGDEDAPERPQSSAGLFHNAFRVPSRAALGDALARIRDRWELTGASDHDVSEALYLRDPEGNGVEIYRDFPREEWPRDGDGTVRMGTHPLDLEPLAAAAAGDSTVPAGTDVGHVHLEAASMAAFRDFYVDTVGFDVQVDMPAALFTSAGGYHHHVAANTWNRRAEPAGGRGLSWFELLVPDAAALDAVRDRIADGQYAVTDADDGFAVAGPDGIEVRFSVDA